LRGKLADSEPPAFAGVDRWIMNGEAREIP